MRYRSDIDGLRALAVISVILYHSNLGFQGGFTGVDLFFVISGFLIVGIIQAEIDAGVFSFVRFYERRLRRLLPALTVVLIATSIWAITQMLWVDLEGYAKSLMATTLYLSNHHFYALTGYFTEDATIKPLLHTWSLAVEEQFYLLAPLILVFLSRHVRAARASWIVAGLAVASFALSIIATPVDEALAFYLLPTRAWELAAGALIALCGTGWIAGRRRLAEALGLAGLALICWSLLFIDDARPFPGWRAALPVLGAASVIAAGQVRGILSARLLSLPPLVFIGRMSYPLYLWHWPIIVMSVYGSQDPLTRSQALNGIAVTAVLSLLTWRFVEIPIRTRKIWRSYRPIYFASAAATALILTISGTIFLGSGFPQRHDPDLVAMVRERGLLDQRRWLHDRRECHLVGPSQLREGKVCIRGAAGKDPSFALVGDSHADAVSPAVFAAAEQLGIAGLQLTLPGLLPTPGRRVIGTDSSAMVDEFLNYLSARPEVRTVVVTGWWARALTGRSYRDEPTIFVDDEYNGSGLAYNRESFKASLDRLADAFPDRQFIFLDDVPVGRRLDVKSYVRAYAVDGIPPPPGIPAREAMSQRALYEAALIALDTRYENVVYRRVFDSLCDTMFCPLFDKTGQPIFRDGDHLSNVGALRMTNKMIEILSTSAKIGQ